MTGDKAPLAMTMGDPAGIGPELALAAWRDRAMSAPFFVFAAPGILAAAARRAGFATPVIETDPAGAAAAFSNGLPVVALKSAVEDAPGRPTAANAAATIKSIARAVEAVHQGAASAVVTNPIAKAVLYKAGFRFPGHTEYLGELAKAWGGPAVPVMMIWSEALKVGPNSNLDEVVPNYYHRLDANGNLEEGSCCPDTASEHLMMEKLIIDTLVLNATEYKIDGFRFDIMSFHFLYNMQHIKQALAALTPEKDGIDGSKIYLYGEGFNFGDTDNNQIGPNASQVNLYGFGIGTFNDRIRDGIRGGSPFTDERVQGFATGLFTDSSDYTNANPPTPSPQAQLGQYSDWILVGLTGNLRDYTFTDSTGATVTGAEVNYNGQPTGYTKSPIEAVNYCSVHDNQDFFDAVQLKSSFN